MFFEQTHCEVLSWDFGRRATDLKATDADWFDDESDVEAISTILAFSSPLCTPSLWSDMFNS